MLNISFEFRKGIFFIRLIGDLNNESYTTIKNEIKQLITENKFKYVVINTNNLQKVDLDGLNHIIEICNMTKEVESNLVICDKFNIIKRLLNYNFPNIKDEIEVL